MYTHTHTCTIEFKKKKRELQNNFYMCIRKIIVNGNKVVYSYTSYLLGERCSFSIFNKNFIVKKKQKYGARYLGN